ncbi:MAG TPA: hypothetical protein ENN73_02950, partial [Firmicutes bacterium]|nr:hypothetical protein [Bacillota bacterium]
NIRDLVNDFREQNPDADIVIISDHGFQPHEIRVNLGDFLEETGLTVRNSEKIKSFKGLFIRGLNKLDIFKLLRRICGQGWEHMYERYSQPIIWSESPFISIGRSSYGFIYLNPEFKHESADRIKKLINLIPELNKKSGIKVIHSIFRKENLYSGSKLDKLPDILIIPENGVTFSGTFSDIGKGNLPVEGIDDFHQGIHRLKGIFLFNGTGIRKNFKSDISITDIFPTLAGIMKIPIPKVDGTCRKEIMEK